MGAGQGPEVRAERQPDDPRSDLDDGLRHAQPRLLHLRHAVRVRREQRGEAADGRQVRSVARQDGVDLHPARRAGMARRQAGHLRGLHRLDQALGRARRHGPEAHGLRQGLQGGRRQDLPDGAEGALRPGARFARQAVSQRAVHDAQGASPRPTPSSRSTARSARARSSTSTPSPSPARSTSTSRTRSTSRAASPPRAWPAARWSRSTGSRSSRCPTRSSR